ncbi:prepilin peptidase [Vibrio renipiscarius]|uniref:A24 family peptidase n=1 Tax=Vibrio renipiscarius TaxID=1461322 RepID=UPI003550712B
MGVNYLIIGWLGLVILSIVISISDIRNRIIPNRYCIVIFIIALLISSVPYQFTWGLKVVGLMGLFVLLYCFRFWGGGDTKLSIAFLPAISEDYLLLFPAVIGLLGGVLALFYLLFGYFTDMDRVRNHGLPYGIPVCLSGLLCVAASF